MNKKLKIGFFVRNSFQVQHFRPLFRVTDGAVWCGRTQERLESFGVGLDEPTLTSRFFLSRKIDERCSIVVTQGSRPQKRRLRKARHVMLQYGYAKETYNYGPWRSEADLILAYGQYAEEQFAKHALSTSIGNPRWDDWINPAFQHEAKLRISHRLNPEKPTVLYVPTWGDLSSLKDWKKAILELSPHFNVLIKAHHNTQDYGIKVNKNQFENVCELPDEDLFGLMCVSDAVISDISGAIFDAILCEKPVILVSPKSLEATFGKRIDENSIEISRRSELGLVVIEKSELLNAVLKALKDGPIANQKLREQLFETSENVAQRFKNALTVLVKNTP